MRHTVIPLVGDDMSYIIYICIINCPLGRKHINIFPFISSPMVPMRN